MSKKLKKLHTEIFIADTVRESKGIKQIKIPSKRKLSFVIGNNRFDISINELRECIEIHKSGGVGKSDSINIIPSVSNVVYIK